LGTIGLKQKGKQISFLRGGLDIATEALKEVCRCASNSGTISGRSVWQLKVEYIRSPYKTRWDNFNTCPGTLWLYLTQKSDNWPALFIL